MSTHRLPTTHQTPNTKHQTPETNLAGALAAWRELLGPEHVCTDEATRTAVQTATFATTQRVPAILHPGQRQEVQECLRIANRFLTPVYPISTGKNWSYGSRVPTQDGCVILDLGRLNRIVDFDEQLAYVSVEPGVTMRQLFEYLQARRSNLMMSVTGSTPETSLIGNIVERGVGIGLYGERFNHVCGLEVVLPTGECVHTGFGRFAQAQTARVGRWGVGPWVDGLFTQSNLGIVTQMTVWLTPKPRYFQAVVCCLNEDARLEGLVDHLQALRLEGTLRGSFSLWNDCKSLAALGQYPWRETGGQTPLPPAVRTRLRQASRGGAWNAVGALYSASRAQARADRRRIRRALTGHVDKLVFIDRSIATLARWLKRPYRWLTGIDLGQYIDTLYTQSSYLGFPTSLPLGSAYWRKKTPVPADPDPDRDRCGIICCAPAIPFTGAHVRAAVSIVEETTAAFGFEPNLSLACMTERCIDVIVFIIYDRDVAGEDGRTITCHDQMLRRLMAAGYFPYRLGLQSMQLLPAADDDSRFLHEALKHALDPNHILAPGRYDFRHGST